jgi:hypothetical protein
MKLWLSPTKLNLFKECERCGFDDVLLKLKRPRSPFPSLPNGIDRDVKHYLDKYRGGLPVELAHLTGHRIMDEQSTINTYREWNGLKCIRNVTVEMPATKAVPVRKITHTLLLNGGIDDALYNDTNQVVVFDVKTKDKEPDDDYGEKYYTTQVNSYAYMLRENGYEVADYGYLWYWWPEGVAEDGSIKFGKKLLKMPVDIQSIEDQLDSIANRLPPVSFEAIQYRHLFKPSPDCGSCSFVQERNDYEDSEKDSLAGAAR